MTDLPGKDTIEATEKRIGRLPIKVLLWAIVIAVFLTASGVIVNNLRSSFTWLQPIIPAQLELNDTAFRVATAFVYVLLAIAGWLVWRTFQKLARDAEEAFGREGVALDAIVESENRIEALQKSVKSIDGRLEYVEKKVGDELTDALTKILIEQGDKRYFAKPEPEVAAEPDARLELGRKLLREAAQELRYAFKEPLSWDSGPSASRGWLAIQVKRLATEILSPDALQELDAFDSALEAKRKLREQAADSKERAAKLIRYLENLADNLMDIDLDEEIDLPPSFEKFRKDHDGQ
jgi:hypothetical protein